MNKKHSVKTLMSLSKQRIADYCIMLENNNQVLQDTIEIQYANCMKLLDDMKILNGVLEKARSTACTEMPESSLEHSGKI